MKTADKLFTRMEESSLSSGYAALREKVGLPRRRIYILPTAAGLLYAVTLIVMLLGAINYDNSLAYALTFLIGSLMPIVILHTYHNLAGLEPGTARPQPVFAGDELHFPITFDNRGREAKYALDLRRPGSRETVSTDLPADSLHTTELPVATEHRGELALDRVRIATSFPLGLFRAWTHFPGNRTGIVYPRPAGPLPLPQPTDYQGEDTIGQMSGTEDFIGFRNYHPGDPIRSIDWKAVARGQALLIKRFSGSGSRQLDLNWDHTRTLGDTERRLSQLSRWVVDAERLGMRYRLTIPGTETPLDSGPQHQHRCLLALARFQS